MRSVIEYASPFKTTLPTHLEGLLESIQRKALRIVFGKLDYRCALTMANQDTFGVRELQPMSGSSKVRVSIHP